MESVRLESSSWRLLGVEIRLIVRLHNLSFFESLGRDLLGGFTLRVASTSPELAASIAALTRGSQRHLFPAPRTYGLHGVALQRFCVASTNA